MTTIADKRAKFRALHQSGCFVLPNPWDVGSARLLQHLGFEALASTSSGHAWTVGKPDYVTTLDEVDAARAHALQRSTEGAHGMDWYNRQEDMLHELAISSDPISENSETTSFQ